MQQFSIYQTTEELLLKSIILLIEKCYHSNLKNVVLTVDEAQLTTLNNNLWTYSRKQFISHGSKLDPKPEKQPVYITDEIQNPNDASVLMIISPPNIEKILQEESYISTFKRIIIMTDLPEDLKELVAKINKSTKQINKIDCFTQTSNGSWNKVI